MVKTKYSRPQVLLHWISALVIIWATISGFAGEYVDLPPKLADWITFFNVSITTILIPLFIARIYFALVRGKPAGDKNAAHIVAKIVHLALYMNIAVVLASGVLMMKTDINVFHIVHIPQPLNHAAAIGFFSNIHHYACISLALLFSVHILAVVKHALTGHKIMRRMTW
jgi:cytochrome b561